MDDPNIEAFIEQKWRQSCNAEVLCEMDRAFLLLAEMRDRYQRAYEAEAAPLMKLIIDVQSILPPKPFLMKKEPTDV